ncbi:hypothetical protein BDQ17DRAFT_1429088 [Cyathus striatus]|nr:hypothetical protein BDQ17DRAFT_1429088 [Cyathus striatus]
MGQYWTFVNVDTLEAIGLSKLQEWYFSSEPTEMMYDTLLCGIRSWARDRIICVGDNLIGNDIPRGLLSEDELEELFDFEEGGFYDQLLESCSRFKSPTAFQHTTYPKEYSGYVLRNLSKKEYIRGDNAPRQLEGGSSIGHALFACICWSEPLLGPEYMIIEGLPDISRGMWAGDRFDVVLYEDVMKALEFDGWKDVSDEVKRHVEAIFDIE